MSQYSFVVIHTGFTAGNSTRDRSDPKFKEHITYTCDGNNGTFVTIPQGCDKLRTIVEFPSCVSSPACVIPQSPTDA